MKFYEFVPQSIYLSTGDPWLIKIDIWEVNGVWLGDVDRVEGWDEKAVATYPGSEFMHLDFQMAHHPIFSSGFRAFFEERHLPVQFLPIRLQREDGTSEVKGYSVAQILEAVECLDQERTVVRDGKWKKRRNGNYDLPYLNDLWLDLCKIEVHRLFRIDGCSIKLVIREDLKCEIEASGFTGCCFQEMNVSE